MGLLRRKRDELNSSISNKRQDQNNFVLKLEYLDRDVTSLREEMRLESVKLENYKMIYLNLCLTLENMKDKVLIYYNPIFKVLMQN